MMDQIFLENPGPCWSDISLPSTSIVAEESSPFRGGFRHYRPSFDAADGTIFGNSMLPSASNAPPQTSASSATVTSDTSFHSLTLPRNTEVHSTEFDDFCVDDVFNTNFMEGPCPDSPTASQSRSRTTNDDMQGLSNLPLSASLIPVSSVMHSRSEPPEVPDNTSVDQKTCEDGLLRSSSTSSLSGRDSPNFLQ